MLKLKYGMVLLFVMSLAIGGAWANVMIDNADDVLATWTPSGYANSVTTIAGGVSGNARQLLSNPGDGNSYFTTSSHIAGDMSAYMNGSIEMDYKTLGTSSSASGPFSPTTVNCPRYFIVHISGGNDPANQWIEFNLRTTADSGGLGWDTSSAWHTIKLAFVDGIGRVEGSEFDGVAATSATLPTAAKGSGMTTQADVDNMWANVSSMYIGAVNYSGTDYAAVAIDNLQLVPEPATLGLLATGSLLALIRRRRR